MIDIRALTKKYRLPGREVTALDGVTLTAGAGRILGVVGPSGAGKSTLVRCVDLLEKPTSGSIVVDGIDLAALPERELRKQRRRIGVVFQHASLLSSRTAAANVALALEIAGMPKAERAGRVGELLSLVGLADRADAYPAQLSGGQQQRVGIARALAASPSVLLCDEPTSALDPDTSRSVLGLIRELTDRLGLTVVVITHEMAVVREICDDVALLSDGRVVEHGPVGEVVLRPDSRLAAALLPVLVDTAPIPGRTLIDVTLADEAVDRPLISELARQLDIDAVLVGGAVSSIGGRRVGHLRLAVDGGGPVEPLLDFLATSGVRAKVITTAEKVVA
ncbi:methionine ABC transporter ATP-binding protein [Fodinicola acaciae]|uniref:methionine ABC transporter ATP-binding protein n=1 Tax=Fodinicola acaciae TaxID=2681555 RepID=UPI0013D267A0|nr:ATP-binding cassette domain-containing protein [Fodinicola acaciae]